MKSILNNNLEIKYLNKNTDFIKKVDFFLKEWFSDTTKVSVQTSGSTGTPKIFQIEKEKMLNSAKMTCDFLGLEKGQKAFLCLPTEYISGKMMLVRALERELILYAEEPSLSPLASLEEPMDFCAMTPLQVEHSLEKLYLIKNLIIGGAEVSESLIGKINNQLSAINQQPATNIYETYGMSETLSHIALKQIYPVREKFFTILDDVEISVDERGCLRIFAPKLNSEILQTNDLVELNGDREFRFLGRLDNVINSGGVKIFPEQLEALVKKEIPNEVVFLGISDEVLGQKLVLVVEGEEDKGILEKLSCVPYDKKLHRPKEIIFVGKIPRTPNGKVKRSEIKEILEKNN